jgi:hypothetical protein
MLRIVRIIGMTLVAMLALSGVASAHNFNATKAGALSRVSNTPQVFKTGAGSEVTCSTDAVTGSAVSGNSLHQLVDISYSGCKVLGFVNAEVSLAQYLLSADLLALLENTVIINIPFVCHITVKPQHFPTGLLFTNKGSNLVETTHVSGIKSEGSGSECGTVSSTGTYTGTTEVAVAGGTLSWS